MASSNITAADSAMYDDGTYLEANAGWHAEDSPYKADLVSAALSRANVTFQTCLDVGCGAGLVTEILAKKFPDASFTGFDSSADAKRLWANRDKLGNLTYVIESPANKGDYLFDVVVCLDVMEHVPDYFQFLGHLKTMGKVFVFNIPLDMNITKIATGGIAKARKSVGHIHYFNDYTAIETLKDAKYNIVDIWYAPAFLTNAPRTMQQALALPIRWASLALGKKFASRWFGGISLVVVATAEG